MLRYSADWRTVAYLVAVSVLGVVQWNLGPTHSALDVTLPLLGTVNVALYLTFVFLCIATAVISHNHNHLNLWKSKPANVLTSYVITIHYGHPCIAWVPTHNQNHHKLNNREGDTGRSPGLFKKNHLLSLLTYPTYTGLRQQADIKRFLRELKQRDRKAWAIAVSEYVVYAAFLLAVFLLDWRKAVLFYVIPQQFALFTIQVFNYVQHVEADAESQWNHSRNFVSPVLNALLFNNGYHTVHHMKPGVHWSQTPALHAQHAKNIHPALLQRSWWGYMVWTFLLRPLVPGARAPTLRSDTPAGAR